MKINLKSRKTKVYVVALATAGVFFLLPIIGMTDFRPILNHVMRWRNQISDELQAQRDAAELAARPPWKPPAAAADGYRKRCDEICGNPFYKKEIPNREACISNCQSYQKDVEHCAHWAATTPKRGMQQVSCMYHAFWPEEDPEETFAKDQQEAENTDHWYFYNFQGHLATDYRDGYGVKQDYVQADKWCRLSVKYAAKDILQPVCTDIEKYLSPEQNEIVEKQVQDWVKMHPHIPKRYE